MGRVRWQVSAGAAVLFALLYFFDELGVFAALFPAALLHELGHVLALRLCAARLRRVSVGVFGVELDYTGSLSPTEEALSAAAGPAAGLLYALGACTLGGAYLRLSGALSFCLTVFNLLPALPLDGGRILASLAGERVARRLSRALALCLTAGGLALLLVCRLPAPLLAGCWLTVWNFRGVFRGKA